jgi:hypothetical protein
VIQGAVKPNSIGVVGGVIGGHDGDTAIVGIYSCPEGTLRRKR